MGLLHVALKVIPDGAVIESLPMPTAFALTTMGATFRKVTTSYWPGFFHCYEVTDLLRTNNDRAVTPGKIAGIEAISAFVY